MRSRSDIAAISRGRYDWPRKKAKGGLGINQDRLPHQQKLTVVVSLTRLQHLYSIFYIPYVKRVAQSLANLLFAILFAVVAFQPLCEPMNGTHLALFGWMCANFLQSLIGFALQARDLRLQPSPAFSGDLVLTSP